MLCHRLRRVRGDTGHFNAQGAGSLRQSQLHYNSGGDGPEVQEATEQTLIPAISFALTKKGSADFKNHSHTNTNKQTVLSNWDVATRKAVEDGYVLQFWHYTSLFAPYCVHMHSTIGCALTIIAAGLGLPLSACIL